MGKTGIYSRRALALVLSLVMVITIWPFMEGDVFAAGDDAGDNKAKDEAVRVEKLPDDVVKAEAEKAKAETLRGTASEEVSQPSDEDESEELTEEAEGELPEIKVSTGLEGLKRKGLQAIQVDEPFITVSKPNKYGKITIKGDLSEYYSAYGISFDSIYVDNKKVNFDNDVDGWVSFTANVSMKNYNVGYHTIYFYYNDRNGNDLVDENGQRYVGQATYVPTYIYAKPSNRLSWYETKIKSFNVYYGGSSYKNCSVYLYYKKGRKKWTKKNYGPVSTSSYRRSKKGGFRPNTTIKVRMTYAKKFKYKGKSYAFTGRLTKKYSKAVKIKTGYKRPKVKSIKITKAKVKTYTYKVHYANRIRYVKSTGRIISITPLYHTYHTYQTKFKVTVKFRKKQGIAGVRIRTKDLYATKYGNKKKYSVWFTLNGKKKGKKTTVSVESFRSRKYGGWSKKYRKKVKIKR